MQPCDASITTRSLCSAVHFVTSGFSGWSFDLGERRTVLVASFLLATVRWLLIGHYPDNLPVLVVAQSR